MVLSGSSDRMNKDPAFQKIFYLLSKPLYCTFSQIS
jgi:hypothetical protein